METSKRILAGFGVAAFWLSGCSKAPPDQPPNIVLILADDLGWHQIGAYGSSFYETPYIDALSAQGMRFTDAYMASSICSPARVSIMTGKCPARLRLTDLIKGRDPQFTKLRVPQWTPYLSLAETTIPEVLKQSGYVSGHFGKWHLNKDKDYEPGRPMDPGSQGFAEVLTTKKPDSPKDPNQSDWHHVQEITDRALAFIEANQDQPLFCYVTHNSIHRPEMEEEALDRVALYWHYPHYHHQGIAPSGAIRQGGLQTDRVVRSKLGTLWYNAWPETVQSQRRLGRTAKYGRGHT